MTNATAGIHTPQAAPFQGRGFTRAERRRVRERARADYGSEACWGRAALRAFARSEPLRQLVLTASRPFTDPSRRARPDRDADPGVTTLYVEGFSTPERASISRALLRVYRSESQALRSLALAYDASAEVRQVVKRLVAPT